MQVLWMLIPKEAYILLIAGSGFAIMLGILTPTKVFSLIGLVCLIALITPFITSLPDWALLLLNVWFIFTLIQAFFGKRVMENVLGMFLFHLLFLPFKFALRLIGFGRLK